MDVSEPATRKATYTTPPRVQAWFLGRSRARWKRKYQHLKVEAKRLQNRVRDVTKSRAQWRVEAQQLRQRVRELEAENTTLREQAKKQGGRDADRSGQR